MSQPAYAMESSADSDLTLFRDNVRLFLKREVAPYFESWEQSGITPRELWRKLGEAGLLCIDVPENYGGHGAPFEYSCAAVEEMARAGYGSLTSNLAVHSDIVAQYILHLGTEQQKSHYLPKMATGEIVGAIAMTEPVAGSDLQGIKATARKVGDGFVINGSKTFITNGQHADVVITFANTDAKAGAKGKTLFLVDSNLPGFSRGRNLEKLGQHSGDTSELFYSDVHVPASAILGSEGNGFGHLVDELPRERLVLSVASIGAAEGAIELTVDYVKNRQAFGAPLSRLQNTRFELAQAKTDTEIAKAFLRQCIGQYAAGSLTVTSAAMCKLSTAENQFRVADRCLQLFGGYGYMREYPISRFFADARVQRIYGGTSEIMKEVVARSFLGR